MIHQKGTESDEKVIRASRRLVCTDPEGFPTRFMSSGKDDVYCVSWRGNGGGLEERSSGRNWTGCRVDESLIKIEYQSFHSQVAPASMSPCFFQRS